MALTRTFGSAGCKAQMQVRRHEVLAAWRGRMLLWRSWAGAWHKTQGADAGA
jgi:hypothetical protein